MKNDQKQQLLAEWKQEYLKALIKKLNPSGEVLEIGFGLGDAANLIQSHHPKKHVIIESDPELVLEAKTWARIYPNVTVIHGNWQKELPKLGVFDAVFLGDYAPEADAKTLNYLYPKDLSQATVKAKELIEKIEEELSEADVSFTDQEIDEFYHKIGEHNQEKLPRFFNQLKERGNISEKQYTAVVKKYHLAKEKKQSQAMVLDLEGEENSIVECAIECFAKHMLKGGRFTAFIADQQSLYENGRFSEQLIMNPTAVYKEEQVVLKPGNKSSTKLPNALVMLVEKA